jgi:hypothetical protein
VRWQKGEQGYRFFICELGFFDCFSWWLDAHRCLKKVGLLFKSIVMETPSIESTEKQWITLFLTNKK